MELALIAYKLFPERGLLAEKMAASFPLTTNKMWTALPDLHALCLCDSDVLHLPGLHPVKGACPVTACQQSMDSLSKSQRNGHAHDCVRRELAENLNRLH
ncbi:uncharacterized protein Z520_11760 [Fonsecaea multimorphosa CBS 102226]|uniref:Uncharacterized protein n=1 Tax=Fonsecaea multimorphosa CBS 102226 TaxID=1442371 RepID=A0A0D2JPZ7_9EURO|nr:uncharacterized protein Z520_11760 [Fonsecaea multimorphosa CBS 102226]KIX92584.1 hypothetical protein Z520_11760 [Fonsecaea multimorphosa CBS 102226]